MKRIPKYLIDEMIETLRDISLESDNNIINSHPYEDLAYSRKIAKEIIEKLEAL